MDDNLLLSDSNNLRPVDLSGMINAFVSHEFRNEVNTNIGLYIAHFNRFPASFDLSFDSTFDVKNHMSDLNEYLRDVFGLELFTDAISLVPINVDEEERQNIRGSFEQIDGTNIYRESSNIIYINKDKHIVVTFNPRNFIYFSYDREIADIEQQVIDLHKKIINEWIEKKEEDVVICCVERTPMGNYILSGMPIKNNNQYLLCELYDDDFECVDKNICSFIENDNSGLVILHGSQGTGKTSYIRYLINKYKDKTFVYLPMDLVCELTSPQMLSFIKSDLRNSVIIIEDCEQLLRDRSAFSGLNSGISNVLNMADGILGDYLNLKFICTFNSDLKNIDSALLRKGRLIDKYEFKKLNINKTNALLDKVYGEHFDNTKELVIADIFNYDKENHGGNVGVNKIGF